MEWKLKSSNNNQSWDPAYVGQGVSIELSKTVTDGNNTYLIGRITDGNGKPAGTFEISDDRQKMYLDVKSIAGMKRKTIVNLLKAIADGVEFALAEQLEAESDEAPAADPEESQEAAEE